MQASVRIVDWEPGVARRARPALRLVSQTLTAGELIAERIADECRAIDANARQDTAEPLGTLGAWLVVPGKAERALNGAPRLYGPGAPRRAEPESETALARRAFEGGQFVMLFDGRQIEAWDERITIRDDSVATFIKLTPLRGG
jgi:hypothetical protein